MSLLVVHFAALVPFHIPLSKCRRSACLGKWSIQPASTSTSTSTTASTGSQDQREKRRQNAQRSSFRLSAKDSHVESTSKPDAWWAMASIII